jgi:hypothetical protein
LYIAEKFADWQSAWSNKYLFMSERSGKEQEEEKKDPFDGEYLGNIWGWRFSLFGLALLLIMLSLMIYRHYTLGVPFGGEPAPEPEKREAPADTVNNDSLSLADYFNH